MPDDAKIETWIKHETKIQYTKQYPKDPFACPQKGRIYPDPILFEQDGIKPSIHVCYV